MKKAIVALVITLLFIPALSSFSQTPDVRSLVREMKEVLEPPRTSMRSLDIVSTDHRGDKLNLTVMQANKKIHDERRMLLVVREPFDIKGSAYLVWEREKDQVPIYIYIPGIRRIREMLGMRAYDSFLATDFTYADLNFIPVHEGYKLIGEEKHDNVRAYKVEETIPKERMYYSRIITWIAADTKLPLERDYYDVAGRLWKKEIFKNVTVVDGIPTPMDIVMKDIQNNSTTEIKVISIKNDAKIPDEMFTAEYLPKALDASVWKELEKETLK